MLLYSKESVPSSSLLVWVNVLWAPLLLGTQRPSHSIQIPSWGQQFHEQSLRGWNSSHHKENPTSFCEIAIHVTQGPLTISFLPSARQNSFHWQSCFFPSPCSGLPSLWVMYLSARAAMTTKYHKLGGYTAVAYFLKVLETGSQRSGFPQGWFLAKPLFLACRRLCPHMTFPLCVWSVRDLWCLFTIRAPPLCSHWTLMISWKALSPDIVILEVKASIYEFMGDTIQSITGVLPVAIAWIKWLFS